MTEILYLNLAGFNIKLVFQPTNQIYFEKEFLEGLKNIWGKRRFLKKSQKKHVFEIVFKAPVGMLLAQKDGNKDYYLIFEKDLKKKRVFVYGYPSLTQIQMLLKEILSILLEKDGFILHAASCLDKKGKLHVFMAPSGGGKTTAANLLSARPGFKKFSDDLLIARKKGKNWQYFSPPFIERAVLPRNEKAVFASLYFVKKAKSPYKKPIQNKADILKKLIRQLWLRTGKISTRNLHLASKFSMENEFLEIGTTLNRKNIVKTIRE